MEASQHPQEPADRRPLAIALPGGVDLALEGSGVTRLTLMVNTVLEALTDVDDPGSEFEPHS